MSRPAYAHGPSDTPLRGETIGRMWDDVVGAHGDRPALVSRHQGIRWTYGELDAEVTRCARALAAAGVRKGDRVGIWSPNNAEWVVTQFATAKAGLILVNINPAYRLTELEYALKKAGCAALIRSAGMLIFLLSAKPERGPICFTASRCLRITRSIGCSFFG